jgi:hypothetical protein
MVSSKTHPHIESPSEEQLREVVKGRSPMVRQLYLDIHRLVLETLPDVVYSVDCHDGQIGYGARQYGYDGWGLAALAPYARWVSLAFLRGTDLDDRDGLLEGAGHTIRHVKLRSPEQLAERLGALRRWIEAASRLNRG